MVARGAAGLQCPACASGSGRNLYSIETTSHFAIWLCRDCGLAYAWPRPTAADLRTFYSADYFANGGTGRLGYADYRFLGEINAHRMWSSLSRYWDLASVRPRHVLDVGCATGGFLAEAKKAGWKCLGVELSSDAAQQALEELGVPVVVGDIFAPELCPGEFGLVTMWHALEHLIEPALALIRARELLADGGLLFIELPNWNSLGRIVKGQRWSQMKPPEHINFFSPRSLRTILTGAGFYVLKTTAQYPHLVDQAQLRRWSRPLHMALRTVGAAASAARLGGYVRTIARKV